MLPEKGSFLLSGRRFLEARRCDDKKKDFITFVFSMAYIYINPMDF